MIQNGIVQYRLQSGMATGQIIDLTVGVKLLICSPECPFLGVINREIPGQDLCGGDTGLLFQQRQKIRLWQLIVGQLCKQQRQLILFMQLQPVLIDSPVHMNRQIRQTQQRLIKTNPFVRNLSTVIGITDAPGQAQIPVSKRRQNRPAINFDLEPGQSIAGAYPVRPDPQPGRVGMRPDNPETRFGRCLAPQDKQNNGGIIPYYIVPSTRLQRPLVCFFQPDEPKFPERCLDCSHRMPRTGTLVDEIQQISYIPLSCHD